MSIDKRIVCSLIEPNGMIKYLVVNAETGICEKLTYEETSTQVLSRQITNAKMENTVIKIVDAVWNQSQLRCSSSDNPKIFYVFQRYKSKLGTDIIVAISNTGELFEMSENIAVIFLARKDVMFANGLINNGKINLMKKKGFTSALYRSYENTHHTHH